MIFIMRKTDKAMQSQARKNVLPWKDPPTFPVSRYIMIAVAVVAFSGSIVAAVAGIYAWKEQKMVEEYLASTKEIREAYSGMALGVSEVVGIYWDEHVSEESKFSLLYPDSWHLSDSDSPNNLEIASTGDPDEEDRSSIVIRVQEFPDAMHPVDLVTEASEIYIRDYYRTDFPVDGQNGVLFSEKEVSDTSGGMVLVTCGARLYDVSWSSSTPEAAAENEIVMRAIVGSLRFLEDCSTGE